MPILKLKRGNHPDDLALADDMYESISTYAHQVLAETSLISLADRELIETAATDLEVGFRAMKFTIDTAFASDSRKRQAAYQVIAKLMLDVFMIGGASTLTPEAKTFLHRMKAFGMRASRSKKQSESPEEIALWDAIREERGHLDGPSDKPNKEADAILNSVNDKLKAKGFEPVHVDKIRRRLEKLGIAP